MKTNFTHQLLFRSFFAAIFLAMSGIATSQSLHVVELADYSFSPGTLTINVGDTVEWRNTQGWHNVNGTTTTFPNNPESFGNSEGSNWTYSHVFNIAGDYDYQCNPHVGFGMTGTISVLPVSTQENMLTLNLMSMNPHVGQMLYLRIVEKASMNEVFRTSTTATANFTINADVLEVGQSYYIDFFADHNGNGMYDAPPTDHAWRIELNNVEGDTEIDFTHNINFTDIMWKYKLTMNFMAMNPHVGQMMHFKVSNQSSMEEVYSTSTTVSADFMLNAEVLEAGQSYYIDFFADHNGNGMYDAPPADHAWRIELNDVEGDTTIDFSHNINFTDIMWKYKLTMNFMAMNPHVGQMMHFKVSNQSSMEEVYSTSTTVSADFMLNADVLEVGQSYYIDFFADHNGNGMYDAPPADHAWRIELNDVEGDTTLDFTHNINFTDIMWKYKLTVNFMAMNPHVGQTFYFSLVEQGVDTVVFSTETTAAAEFSIMTSTLEAGKSYNIDFYSDHNSNGIYDIPPIDHAWRIELNDVEGDTTLQFTHNISFTNIFPLTAVNRFENAVIKMYPNPATTSVTLQFDGFAEDAQITLFDITGKKQNIKTVQKTGNSVQLQIGSLPRGIYLLEMQSGTTRQINKLIKQ